VLALKPGDVADPDHSSSATVYGKGAWFLSFLEQRFGRETFDAWLKGYFDRHAFKSMTTARLLDDMREHLLPRQPNRVTEEELQEWVYAPGIPTNAPRAESRKFSTVDAARIAWTGSGTLPAKSITDAWTTQEWVRFLEGMPQTLRPEQLAQLDEAYKLTGTANGEIAQRWYPLAERSGYAAARPAMGAFLERVGRRKLVVPIYRALVATPDGLAFAQQVFARARPGYHPITTGTVEQVIAEARPVAPATPAAPAAAPAAAAPAPAAGSAKADAQATDPAPARPRVVDTRPAPPPIEDPAKPPPAPTR
jgi:aminopeptidase N